MNILENYFLKTLFYFTFEGKNKKHDGGMNVQFVYQYVIIR